jgi:hypothetical protein
MKRCVGIVAFVAAVPTFALAQAGSVSGTVTAKGSTVPLPGVDITHLESGRGTFGTADGTFTLRGLPAGAGTIRVRRVGFSPELIKVEIAAGRTESIRVELSPVAIQLAAVRVGASSCGGRARTDTALAPILEQVRASAERSDLFAKEYPYNLSMERVIVNSGAFYRYVNNRNTRMEVDTLKRDTVSISGWREWTYAPGTLIQPATTTVEGVKDKMMVPLLSDFASPAFVQSHCFRFTGVVPFEGKRRIRIDFEPVRGTPTPDVWGSLYLDEFTFELERSTLNMERPSPLSPAWDTWDVVVNTTFDAIAPGHFAIRRIVSRVTARTSRPMTPPPSGASVETQERIAIRYSGRAPGQP